MNAFRQALRFQIKPDHILPGVCEVAEPSLETEHEEHARVVSERDPRVASLDSMQSCAAEHGAFSHQRRWDAAAPAGVPEVGAQLVEHGECREGERGIAI